tara:strand:- start:2819 stop:3085 length:267 start_codon:yes stop_codon:yes gene_type:complete
MLHKISQFCDKIKSIQRMAEDLRVLKYQTPKSQERDFKIQNMIETIQYDCQLIANDKSDYGKEQDEKGNYGDYSGVNHDGMFNKQGKQ